MKSTPGGNRTRGHLQGKRTSNQAREFEKSHTFTLPAVFGFLVASIVNEK
jgi:hypothetical protein